MLIFVFKKMLLPLDKRPFNVYICGALKNYSYEC